MQIPASQVIDELSRLFTAEMGAILAYGRAVSAVEPSPIRDRLALFGLAHQRRALRLHEEIVRQGGQMPEVEPVEPEDRGIGPHGAYRPAVYTEQIIARLRGRDALVASLYAEALAQELPDDVRNVLGDIHAESAHKGRSTPASAAALGGSNA